MAADLHPSSEPLDYATARYADGPRLAKALLPRVPAEPKWENVKRQLRAMLDEHRCVRLETADRLCILLGIHPVLLPTSVWTTWDTCHRQKTRRGGRR